MLSKMSFQSMLQQEEDQQWGGNNGWGGNGSSHRLKALTDESDGGGALLKSGGGGYHTASLTFNTASCSSGYGADLTLFSPSDLLSPSSRQVASSPFNWQSLLCGQASNARWQVPDTPLPAFSAPFGSDNALNDYGRDKRGSGDVQNDLRLAHESSASDGVISEVEGEVKEEWTTNMNPEKEAWRKFGGEICGII